MKTLCHKDIVGSLRFAHLFFLITQPWMHQSSKSLCPLLREVPEDSKTPTWMILCQVIAIERKLLFSKIDLIWISSVCATLLLAILSAKCCANFASWGCFGILRVFLSITHKSFSKNGQ